MNDPNKLVIGNDAWKGFQGMFIYYNQGGLIGFYYKINDLFYDAKDLTLVEEDISKESYHSGCDLIDPFTINTNGSEILVINIEGRGLLYQQLPNGEFIQISPTSEQDKITGDLDEPLYTLKVPLPNGKEINGIFQKLLLNPIDKMIIKKIENYVFDIETDGHLEFLRVLNSH